MTPETIHAEAATARQTLADLEHRREQVAARLHDIEGERKTVAHGALTGNDLAKDKLQALKAEAVGLADDQTDIASAIAEARQNVAVAEESVAALGRRDTAKRQAALADEFEAAAAVVTKALAEFVGAYGEVERIAIELHAAGARIHDHGSIKVHMARATQSALLQIGLQSETLAPRERTDMSAMVSAWVKDIRDGAHRTIRGVNASLGAEKRRAA